MSANEFKNLPVGSPGVPGAAVDVSQFSQGKEFVFEGPANFEFEIQFSHDGSDWFDLKTYKGVGQPSEDKDKREIAAKWMRCSVPAGKVAPTNVDVGGVAGGTDEVVLAVPTGVGIGASNDISALGSFNTLAVGSFTDGELAFEISQDDVTWEECFRLKPGHPWASATFVAQYCRINRISGTGTPSAVLCASNDATTIETGAGGGGVVVYRPGATGANAPGGNVHTDFKSAFDAAKALTVYGNVTLEFDNFHEAGSYFGLGACLIPSSAGEPGGVWDMAGIKWRTAQRPDLAPFIVGAQNASIVFQEGAIIENLQEIEGNDAWITQEFGVTTSPFGSANQRYLTVSGDRTVFMCFGSAPLWNCQAGCRVRTAQALVCFGDVFGFFGPNQPVIDLNGEVFQPDGDGFLVMDDVLSDTAGGGELSYTQRGNQWFLAQNYEFSGLAPDTNLTFGGPRHVDVAVEVSGLFQEPTIDINTGFGAPAWSVRTRANAENEAGQNTDITAPNGGGGSRGMYWGCDNEGAVGTLTLTPNKTDQVLDGKFSYIVPAGTRTTWRADGGQNDYFIAEYDALAGGSFIASGAVDLSWAGGTGEVIDDDGTKMVVRLSTGTIPLDDDTLTQGGVTADVDETTNAVVVAPGNWILVDCKVDERLEVKERSLVFRPDATGVNAPGGRVHTTWASLYAEIQRLRPYGSIRLEFDSRFSAHTNAEGFDACAIPDSSAEPGGFWDMDNVYWAQRASDSNGFQPFFAGDATRIDFLAGAEVQNLAKVTGHLMFITRDVPSLQYIVAYDGGAGTPFSVGETLTFGGGGTATVDSHSGDGTSGDLVFTMVSGTVPANDETISGGTSGNTADVDGTPESRDGGIRVPDVSQIVLEGPYIGLGNTTAGSGPIIGPALGCEFYELVMTDFRNAAGLGKVESGTGFGSGSSLEPVVEASSFGFGTPIRGDAGAIEPNSLAGFFFLTRSQSGFPFTNELDAVNFPAAAFGTYANQFVTGYPHNLASRRCDVQQQYGFISAKDTAGGFILIQLPSAVVRDGDVSRFKDADGNASADANAIYVSAPPGQTVDRVAQVAATGTLTLTGNVANGDEVEIGGKTYTFETVLTDVDGNVLIGATASDSIDNLIAAINLGAGAGTLYATSTTANPDDGSSNAFVSAAAGAGDTMDVTCTIEGIGGNQITTTDPTDGGAVMSWGAATLTGGLGGYKVGGVDFAAAEFQADGSSNWYVFNMNP